MLLLPSVWNQFALHGAHGWEVDADAELEQQEAQKANLGGQQTIYDPHLDNQCKACWNPAKPGMMTPSRTGGPIVVDCVAIFVVVAIVLLLLLLDTTIVVPAALPVHLRLGGVYAAGGGSDGGQGEGDDSKHGQQLQPCGSGLREGD